MPSAGTRGTGGFHFANPAAALRLGPFRHPAFTVLWIATVVSNVGTWMYNAATAWLMMNLNTDPLIV